MTAEERISAFGEKYNAHFELYEKFREQAKQELQLLAETLDRTHFENYKKYSHLSNKHYGISQGIATRKLNRY